MGIRGYCRIVLLIVGVQVAARSFAADPGKSIFDDNGPGQRPPSGGGAAPGGAQDRSSPAATGIRSNATDGATGAPVPGRPATPATSPAAPLPVPSGPALHDAEKRVTDLFRQDFAAATTPPQKAALAHKLLTAAGQAKTDPASRYVLLTRAVDMSLASADTPAGCAAVDLLAGQYRLDPAHRLALLTALSKSADSPRDCGLVVVGLSRVIAASVLQDQYDLAHRADDLAVTTARRSNAPLLITETGDQSRELAEIEAAYPAARRALAALTTNPTDPAASAVAGRFLCFYKGDWHGGLLYLAAAVNDPALREPALAEIKAPPTATARAAVADRWWDLAGRETGLPRLTLRAHARAYYRAALPGLTGVAKANAEKRIAAGSQPAPANGDVVTLAVKGRQGWQKAVPVKKGEKITIAATGTWTTWRDGGYTCDAGGRPDGRWALNKAYPEGALIGRLGDRVALVGKSTTFRAAEDGDLELRCNKDDAHLHDDDGELTVTITRS
jgi:hypothetical protein